jgi:hypothetical protein
MALLVDCRDPATQVRHAACYHGHEHLLRMTDDGRVSAERWDYQQPSCWVQVPWDAELGLHGWKRRGGRLPICPEHAQPGDAPY